MTRRAIRAAVVGTLYSFFYRDRGELATRQHARCDTPATRPGSATIRRFTGYDTTMTMPSALHDTALCARPRRSACAACEQPGPWVGALCTRLSFDLVYCFESLFGTLFMNTVHEHYSRGFQINK